MKYREILSHATGEQVVIGRVELDSEEDACRIVTEFPALRAELENGIMGPGGVDAGPVTPDDGEVYLNALETEFWYGTTRVSEIKGSFG